MPDTYIISLFSINGTEITEHNRRYSGGQTINAADVELDSGINKRYIKKNKENFSVSFSYLPNAANKSVDGRAARDYLKGIAEAPGKKTVLIKLSPVDPIRTLMSYVTSYNETLIKREVDQECAYYDVTISFEEA
jgi:hypothetical protein